MRAGGKRVSPNQDHIPGLDGIRALAIGLVLFAHSVIYDTFSHLRSIGTGAGYAGVAVFFVLSGYLITTLLLREEERTGSISLRLFYLRRALRLFPALWLYLLVVSLIWFSGLLPHHPWHSFASSLLYVRNLVGRGHETRRRSSPCGRRSTSRPSTTGHRSASAATRCSRRPTSASCRSATRSCRCAATASTTAIHPR